MTETATVPSKAGRCLTSSAKVSVRRFSTITSWRSLVPLVSFKVGSLRNSGTLYVASGLNALWDLESAFVHRVSRAIKSTLYLAAKCSNSLVSPHQNSLRSKLFPLLKTYTFQRFLFNYSTGRLLRASAIYLQPTNKVRLYEHDNNSTGLSSKGRFPQSTPSIRRRLPKIYAVR